MAPVHTRILLATEHGDFDVGAELLAFDLARRGGLRLTAVLPLQTNPEFEAVAPQLAAKADAQAAARRRELQARAEAEGVALDLQVRRGREAFGEIVAAARESEADLIVIRRRGKRGLLANLLVGEMVSQVVAQAPCSLLIAPRTAQPWSKRVLAGIDPREPDAATLALAATLAAERGLPLQLVCVAADAAERDAAARVLAASIEQARGQLAAVEGEARVGRAPQALVDAALRHQADLIVIGRQRLGRAWFGDTAQKVIGLAECPVLVRVDAAVPASPR